MGLAADQPLQYASNNPAQPPQTLPAHHYQPPSPQLFNHISSTGVSAYSPSFQALSQDDRVHKLQQLLAKKLGAEYLSTRQGGGGTKLTYIEGWRVINLANEIFGFNGWFTEVKMLEIDFMDLVPGKEVSPGSSERGADRWCIGVSAIVKVWLRDGACHEDVGYGKIENAKSKGDALDKCKKEAVTDALKRTLRNFGSLLGNCLYDKNYTAEVAKMKAGKPKFTTADLYHSSDHQPIASMSTSAIHTPAAIQSHAPPVAQAPTRTPSTTTIPPKPISAPRPPPVIAPKPIRPAVSRQSAPLPKADPKAVAQVGGDEFDEMFDDELGSEGLDEVEGGGGGLSGEGVEEDSGFCEGFQDDVDGLDNDDVCENRLPRAKFPPQASSSKDKNLEFGGKTALQIQQAQKKEAFDKQRRQNEFEEKMKRQQSAPSPQASRTGTIPTTISTVSAAQMLNNNKTATNSVPRPVLRPAQPPPTATRARTYNPASTTLPPYSGPPTRPAGHLPSLTIGSKAGRMSGYGSGGEGNSGRTSVGSLGGVTHAVEVGRRSVGGAPDGVGFQSARGVKRTGKETLSPPSGPTSSGVMREALRELEVGYEGEVKRPRMS